MRNKMASYTEEEMGGFFENCRNVTSISITLEEMVHPQPPATVETGNTAENSTVNGTEKQKISRSIDMRFY